MRLNCALILGIVSALLVAGAAASGTPTAPGRAFTKADVRRILLKPGDAPTGMRLNEDETGPFDCDGGVPIDPKETGDPGCVAYQQIAYSSAGDRSPYAHVGIWLFGTSKQATKILPTAKQVVKDETGHTFTGGPAKGLGWQGFHFVGTPDDGKASSDFYVFYVWRYRNAVLKAQLQGAPLSKVESVAHALAIKLDARAKASG